jgi:hypothetical protein
MREKYYDDQMGSGERVSGRKPKPQSQSQSLASRTRSALTTQQPQQQMYSPVRNEGQGTYTNDLSIRE